MALSALATGCAQMPQSPPERVTESQTMDRFLGDDSWNATPGVQYEVLPTEITLAQPHAIPERVANRLIELDLRDHATVRDLLRAMYEDFRININLDDVEDLNKEVSIPRYSGTLGNYFKGLSGAMNLSFEWRDEMVFVSDKSEYLIRAPQHAELMDSLKEGLESLGVEDFMSSEGAAMIRYRANPVQQKMIHAYLSNFIQNAAVVSLQMAIVNVNLSREHRSGIDWSALSVQLDNRANKGLGAITQPIDPANSGATTEPTNPANPGAETTLIRAAATSAGEYLSMTGTGLNGGITQGVLNLTAVVQALSTYGKAETSQNMTLRTMTGNEVKLRSGEEIPYVSELGAVTSGDNDNVTGSVNTDKVQTGLDITLKPNYDAANNLVTVSLQLQQDTLVGFIELSAGNEVGSLTQPRTQNQSFNNLIRIPAGKSVVMGGLTYDLLENNYDTLTILEKAPAAGRTGRVTRNAMFIVLRPTVTVFEYRNETGTQKLEAN